MIDQRALNVMAPGANSLDIARVPPAAGNCSEDFKAFALGQIRFAGCKELKTGGITRDPPTGSGCPKPMLGWAVVLG